MKIKRRTKIISETEHQFSVFVKTHTAFFFCPVCEEQREMLSINEAVKRSGASWREVVQQIEKKLVHTVETAKGEIYVCAESLLENNESNVL